MMVLFVFFFKQKTAYEMRISDWSSDVCSSDLLRQRMGVLFQQGALFTDLNVFENVAFPLREHTQVSESQVVERVLDKLDAVGPRTAAHQIGRASCRERLCQYV